MGNLYIIPAYVSLRREPRSLPKSSQMLFCPTELLQWIFALLGPQFMCLRIHCYLGQRLPRSFHHLRCIFTHACIDKHTHTEVLSTGWEEFGVSYSGTVNPSLVFVKAPLHACAFVFLDMRCSLAAHIHTPSFNRVQKWEMGGFFVAERIAGIFHSGFRQIQLSLLDGLIKALWPT